MLLLSCMHLGNFYYYGYQVVIAHLNKEHLAQKRVTAESLVLINLEEICLEVSFKER